MMSNEMISEIFSVGLSLFLGAVINGVIIYCIIKELKKRKH